MVGYIAAAVKKEGSWSRSMIPFWHKYQYMKQSWLLTSMVSGLVWGKKKNKKKLAGYSINLWELYWVRPMYAGHSSSLKVPWGDDLGSRHAITHPPVQWCWHSMALARGCGLWVGHFTRGDVVVGIWMSYMCWQLVVWRNGFTVDGQFSKWVDI